MSISVSIVEVTYSNAEHAITVTLDCTPCNEHGAKFSITVTLFCLFPLFTYISVIRCLKYPEAWYIVADCDTLEYCGYTTVRTPQKQQKTFSIHTQQTTHHVIYII